MPRLPDSLVSQSQIENAVDEFRKKLIISGVKENYKIDDFLLKDYPDWSDTKPPKPIDTYTNLQFLLNFFNADIKYNLMTRRREITFPGIQFLDEEQENNSLHFVYHLSALNKMPVKNLDKHLDVIAWKNAYHPIQDCILNKPWDNIPRLDKFIKTLKTTNDELSHVILKTWMTLAISMAFNKGHSTNQGVLVLQGAQGIGKTSFAKSLDPIGCGAIKEGAFLDPMVKDDIINTSRYWIVELGELETTLNKSDIGRLKSFITNERDSVRLPYAVKETNLIRRTAYIATVNEESFLIDTTGNRRWWTIAIESINLNHKLDMQQIWAEVYHYWQLGDKTYLQSAAQELVNEENKKYEKVNPIEEALRKFYDWDNKFSGIVEMTSTEVLQEINWKKIDQSTATITGSILQKITGKKARRTTTGRFYEIPAKRKI